MKPRTGVPLGLVLLMLCLPGLARAQGGGLAFLLRDLLEVIELDNRTHEAHFIGGDQLDALSGAFIAAVGPQLATVPLGSPGGGLTFTFDEETGVFARSSRVFGSIYQERALTVGRSRWNAGVSFQSAHYDSFGDFDLGAGDIRFQLRHQDVAPFNEFGNPELEEDVIGASLAIDLSTETAVFFFTYGVTDKLDVSVAVPFVSVDLAARADLELLRLESDCARPDLPGEENCTHRFPSGGAGFVATSDSTGFIERGGSASGIGDILVRGKYRFRDAPGGGMALGVDLRLATGEEEELIGTGGTSTRLYLIGSREWDKLAPHFNVGYTFSSAGGDLISTLSDEINYSVGVLYAASERVTVGADLVGRQLLDAPSFVAVSENFNLNQDSPATDRSGGLPVFLPNLAATTDDVDILLGAFGVRFNPTGNLLVSLNLLSSLSSDGLEDGDLIPVLAVDYSF